MRDNLVGNVLKLRYPALVKCLVIVVTSSNHSLEGKKHGIQGPNWINQIGKCLVTVRDHALMYKVDGNQKNSISTSGLNMHACTHSPVSAHTCTYSENIHACKCTPQTTIPGNITDI